MVGVSVPMRDERSVRRNISETEKPYTARKAVPTHDFGGRLSLTETHCHFISLQ